MPSTPFRVSEHAEALDRAAAEHVTGVLRAALAARGRAAWALAGGSTPRALYARLATPPWCEALDWSKVDLFFGDERCVGPDDPASNYAMARESLIEPLSIDPARVHRIEAEQGAEVAASRYEFELRRTLPGDVPSLDLVLLGMGDDGHTASIFPQPPESPDERRLVRASTSPKPPADRVTMTLRSINAAGAVTFLVRGADKAPALARVRRELDTPSDEALPAARVRPTRGRLLWLVDRTAAGES